MILEKKKFDVEYFYKGADEDLHIIGIRDEGGDTEERYEYIENREDLIYYILTVMDYDTELEIIEAGNVKNSPTLKGFYIY